MGNIAHPTGVQFTDQAMIFETTPAPWLAEARPYRIPTCRGWAKYRPDAGLRLARSLSVRWVSLIEGGTGILLVPSSSTISASGAARDRER